VSARTEAHGKLSTYRAKRDFAKTPEPSGARKIAPAKRLRFVIQKHAATRLHYDFRLELDGVMKSWAVTRGPSLDPADKRLAVEVEDHPLDYGDFEGTIPKGQYGGGTVMLWDRGYWEPEGSPHDALKKGDLKFTLAGDKLHGSFVLVRMRRREREKRDNWLLIKHRDEYSVEEHGDRILSQDRSVASGRAMEEIASGKGRPAKPFILKKTTAADAIWNSDRANGEHRGDRPVSERPKSVKQQRLPAAKGKPVGRMPDFVEPELCRTVETPPRATGWGHEIKLDGYRLQLRVERGKATLRTRKGLPWTDKFGAIAAEGVALPDCIIDGEVCALDRKGNPDFPILQAAIADGKTDTLVYFAFDLLFHHGRDLRALGVAERKERLRTVIVDAGPRIRYVDHLESDGLAVLEAATKMGLEGIISKRLDAPYKSGRHGSWTKSKLRGGQEVVVGGWTEEDGRFRSLLVGAYHNGKLDYVGRVGTGYDGQTVRRIYPQLKAVASATSPFTGANAPKQTREMHWAKPILVAEIEFAGWSSDGIVRQGSFKALRDDKPATEVRAEMLERSTEKAAQPHIVRPKTAATPKVLGVDISHPDKVLWPADGKEAPVTKLDLARYYEAMAKPILAYIKGRPCSIIRAPDGIAHEQFFQRHGMLGASKLMTFVKVEGEKKPYLQLDTPAALIAAAQISAVELHPWNCAPGDPETPGRLVFDLDPAPDVDFVKVIEAARELNERLKQLDLVGFCKTTGGKGLHVVTPFKPSPAKLRWPEVKEFALEVCRRMAADSPAKYLTTMAKKDRTGRIFLDYLRNDRTSTAVAQLSPRARPGAPVSMPVDWAQVRAGLDPKRYSLRTAPALIARSNPWADYDRGARSFAAAAKKLAR